MTVNYNLGSTPFWYFSDNSGKALIGGYLWSFSASNPNLLKPIYSDPNGINPYPNPIPITATGFVKLFQNLYFADDDNYYLAVTQSATSPDAPIASTNEYNAAGTGGGGGSTIYLNISNLITNGQFIFNIKPNFAFPVIATLTPLAPSNHNGLTTPDIILRKDNTSSTETTNFISFNQGEGSPSNPLQTPRFYLEYACTSAGSETQKDIEFPISAHVRTLETQIVTVGFAGRSSSSSIIDVFTTQYFGDGNNSPSPPAQSIMQSVALNTLWNTYLVNIVIPTTAGKTLGNCGNDYLAVSIRAPLNQVFNFDITNVMLLDGALTASYPYVTQDHTSSVIYAPRTGDIKLAFSGVLAAFGWLPMTDGTIGSESSAATDRANIDTFPLYSYLWNNVSQPSGNAQCPVVGGLGGSAVADFTANKPLTLSKVLGRALAGAGLGSGLTNRPLGSFLGEENHTQTISEMPAHNHPGSTVTITQRISTGGGAIALAPTQSAPNVNLNLSVTSQGSGTPFNVMQPTTFMNVYIKL